MLTSQKRAADMFYQPYHTEICPRHCEQIIDSCRTLLWEKYSYTSLLEAQDIP
jgi:hypothetical protein